jgi:hypothetical protein
MTRDEETKKGQGGSEATSTTHHPQHHWTPLLSTALVVLLCLCWMGLVGVWRVLDCFSWYPRRCSAGDQFGTLFNTSFLDWAWIQFKFKNVGTSTRALGQIAL